MNQQAQALRELEEIQKTQKLIEKTCSNIFNLGSDIYNYSLDKKHKVHEGINLLVNQLNELNEISTKNLDICNVPIDLVRFVDDAKNPDIYLNEVYEMVKIENEKAIKRRDNLKRLSEGL